MKSDIAFLVFAPLKKKRKNDSFDGNDNIGALVVKDILERKGIVVDFCAPETACSYHVVLVSLTSTYDVYSFFRQVARRPEWQRKHRKFKVVIGGFGLQNPYPIRNYADYALFGRADDIIEGLVSAALTGKPYIHDSVMNLPDITPVKIAQTQKLYAHPCKFSENKEFKESFVGCPNKCKFCHYTWARENKGHHGEYVNQTLAGASSPEMTWKEMIKSEGKLGRTRSAIDGFSQRIRFLFGKRISCDDVTAGIERLGAYEGNTVCIVYNVSNMPTETEDDRQELYSVIARSQPENRVIIVLHSTPFRPSLVTPMQWEGVTLMPNWNKYGASVIYDSDNLRAVHSTGNEAPYSHLISVIAERATTETDKLFQAICFNPKLQSGTAIRRMKILQRNFNLHQYLRQYDIGDPDYPASFLTGYINQTSLMRIAQKMRKDAEYSN